MEKVGLVKRESHIGDARVSYVVITTAGEAKLKEAHERIGIIFDDIIHPAEHRDILEATKIISKLSSRIV